MHAKLALVTLVHKRGNNRDTISAIPAFSSRQSVMSEANQFL